MAKIGGDFSNREKLLGGGIALLAAYNLLQGSFSRITHHPDDKEMHPVEEVHEHTRQLVDIGKAIDKLTNVVEKQHDEDVKMQERAQVEAEKRSAEAREFWVKQQTQQTKDLVLEIMRQPPVAVVPVPQRRGND